MTLPAVPESFYWTESPCGLVLKCRPLEAVAPHLFTTRELSLTGAADWQRVAAALSATRVATLNLVDRWFVSRDRPPLRLDIAAANRDQLVLAGVPEAQIHACGLCTAMHLDLLTSYRAEKERAGRMAGVIMAPAGPRPSVGQEAS